MALDHQLLEKARNTGALLQDAERRALLCRADYHTAIRRLHLAGGSLREIAETLSLSHQRVQQIVSAAGGSWWTRVWRTRNMAADAVCSWCGRPPAEVEKLIAGPHVYICDRCVTMAGKETSAQPAGSVRQAGAKTSRARCAFCGKRVLTPRKRPTASAGHICPDCLRLCREILDASEAS
jgi:ClpX C4-type zinc finger protein